MPAKKWLAKITKNHPLAVAADKQDETSQMMAAMIKDMPLRALMNFSQGAFAEEMLGEMIRQLNEAQHQFSQDNPEHC